MANPDPKDWIELGEKSRGVRLERTKLGQETQIFALQAGTPTDLVLITVGKYLVTILNEQDDRGIQVKAGHEIITLLPGKSETSAKEKLGESFHILLAPGKEAEIVFVK